VIQLFSVPHTGTHFLKEVIESAGVPVKARHVEGWSMTDDLVVCPIRNPLDTYKSWIARGRDQDFTEKWNLLNTIYKEQQPLIIPIDTDERDRFLKMLGILLGKTLTTDWSPVNKGINKKQDVDVDLSDVYSLQVVRDFYGQL
jgi:hypothetical protein